MDKKAKHFDVTEEIKEHVDKQGIVLGVEDITNHRYNGTTKQWELLISWLYYSGRVKDFFWEPLEYMKADFPAMVRA
ncbi:hypothetical protein PsorP6_016615 [Peronosclerospora sorghi]|uniref:Uncharacterized protein n=1 Tax=Peronosclerospora sorghi TaxID=230839 RepID=A0ACC0VMN7_9STRA|nr:hypothetical protein PsorP6_016615 [Peronosclerospora sorghi]